MNLDRPINSLKSAKVAAFACGFMLLPALAHAADLATKTGNDLGVTVSGYKYTEPGVMSVKATKVGFDYSGTYALGSEWPNRSKGWFVRADLRYVTGKADYNGGATGTLNNVPDWYYEARGLVGKDFHYSGYTLSPYAGLGFRYLFNDLRGTTSTGGSGYRREGHYTTLPLGVTHKMNLASQQAQLVTTFEYSYLLRGRQDSKLSDTGAALQDVSLAQRSGYGLRLGTMVRYPTWSIGPSLILWRVNESDRSAAAVIEPHNNTYEFGVKAAYHF